MAIIAAGIDSGVIGDRTGGEAVADHRGALDRGKGRR